MTTMGKPNARQTASNFRAIPKPRVKGLLLSDATNGPRANQLLGRIKNKLLTYGVTLEMSTPTVIFGLELIRKSSRSSICRQFSFRQGEDALSIYFDAVAAPGFELTPPTEPPEPGIAEGE